MFDKRGVNSLCFHHPQGHPMLAVYPGNGAAYGRHLDSTGGRRGNGRVLTLVLYLNPFWQPAHGGCLRLLEELADESGPEIEPLHGRLVGFLCEDQNPHEPGTIESSVDFPPASLKVVIPV